MEDASGTGFGSSSWKSKSREVKAEYGSWIDTITNQASSNFRESAYLVRRLKDEIESGNLEKGSEVWVFTDNSTAEAIMYKGSSKSEQLHYLVLDLDLRKMEMKGELIIHFVWISGTRMIFQGTDGLSRGDFTSGVMAGDNYLKFLPLNQTAFERCQTLENKVLSWCAPGRGYSRWRITTPKDWFHQVFTDPKGAWIWCPPPVLAKVAVEQMCEVKHIFPRTRHLFLCPAILTGVWRKQLMKISDAYFSLGCGSLFWSEEMYEPLTVSLLVPPLSSPPYKKGNASFLEKWESNMQVLSRNDVEAFRDSMRKFWR